MKPLFLSAFLVLLVVVLLQGRESAQAQSIFLEPNNIPAVHLEAIRPGFQVRFPLDKDLRNDLVPSYSIRVGVKL